MKRKLKKKNHRKEKSSGTKDKNKKKQPNKGIKDNLEQGKKSIKKNVEKWMILYYIKEENRRRD